MRGNGGLRLALEVSSPFSFKWKDIIKEDDLVRKHMHELFVDCSQCTSVVLGV